MGRRRFIKYGAAAAVAVGIAATVKIPLPLAQTSTGQTTQQQDQTTALQEQITSNQGFTTLSIDEQRELEAIVEAIIPTDSNGPGAKEAGVIYFIDKQLGADYGTNARMYMKAPFIQPGVSGPLTVGGVTYPAGSQSGLPWQAGMKYQYNLPLREFWRYGLEALQTYSNKAFGKNFENLSNADQVQVLNDLYDNKPTDFNGIVPQDFFQELIFMTYSGFFMDPAYGGNIGMVGWQLTGFTGANMADSFNEGRNVLQLMVASKPTRYPPHSLGDFQKTLNLIGGS